MAELRIGTEIYYTGDRANHSGFGVVTAIELGTFGTNIGMRLEDGRKFYVRAASFQPSPGQRFMTKAAWKADRQAKIDAMHRERVALGLARGGA